ncbi:hypothetical protein MERGE_000307 [Pneumocystis wakefieldiae]|uniref:Uncharacterized protein n=1 Tax=Pneumocystis wakefieldiae TaxID=38082 RepID=A0A899FVT1_9ASCO|nr:hypothetical protein MERGE_000307 [Pneumocystis wakefieldiae]
MNQQLNISNKEFNNLTLYEKQILLELQYILKTCEQIKGNLKKAINITNKGELYHKQMLAIESMKIWEKIKGNIS